MIPTIVPAYTAIFAIMLVVLSLRVANMRREAKTSIGDGNNAILRRRIRVQGNFTEYVPISLLLFLFVELQSWPRWLVHMFCLVLLAARLLHAYGVAQEPEYIPYRATAMATTATLLIVASGLLLFGTTR
jgi:uncharacterized membrane protein YecN with MAPEG domain